MRVLGPTPDPLHRAGLRAHCRAAAGSAGSHQATLREQPGLPLFRGILTLFLMTRMTVMIVMTVTTATIY